MKKLFAVFIVVALLLTVSPITANAASNTNIHRAVKIATYQKGDPYSYGAAGPRAFDCSGLVFYSYRRANIKVPRTSSQLAHRARHIRWNAKRPGDLIFYHNSGRVYHVAIYVGHGRVVEAQRPGTRVKVTKMWQAPRFAGTLRS